MLEVLTGDECVRCQNQELIPTANGILHPGCAVCIISDLLLASLYPPHTRSLIDTRSCCGKEHCGPVLSASEPRSYKTRSNPEMEASVTQQSSVRCQAHRAEVGHLAVCSTTPSARPSEEEAPPLPTSPSAPPAQAVAAAAGFEFHQRGHAANSATCFRPKQTQEARTLPPFEPAVLSRSIHGSSGKMGKTLLLLPAPPLPSPFFPGINVSPSVSV